jgi:hypothetical protein
MRLYPIFPAKTSHQPKMRRDTMNFTNREKWQIS